MSELSIQIPVEEYKRFVEMEVRLNLFHEMIVKDKYFLKQDAMRLFGWEEEIIDE